MVLLSFSSSLATKCVSLNDEPHMIRPSLIDLNPFELQYYPFMISLDKCNGSYSLIVKNICYKKKKNNEAFKAFNMVTNENGAKTMVKHVSYDCKCTFSSTTCNSNKKE